MAADKERIIEQLRSQKAFFKYDYGNDTLDPWLTERLAELIAKTGVNDIRDIAVFDGMISYVHDRGYIDYMPTLFYYDAETGNPIQGIGGYDFDPTKPRDAFAAVESDDFVFTFFIRFLENRIPYFVVGAKRKEKDPGFLKWFASTLAPIMPVIVIGLQFIPGLGQAIGQAVLGTLNITASPAIASFIGQTAVNTVLNGGDVESAIKNNLKNQLTGGAGSFVGGEVGSLLNSDIIGKATAAATSAAIAGGDPKAAIVTAMIPYGVQTMEDYVFSSGDIGGLPADDFAHMDPTSGLTDNYPFETGDYAFTMGDDFSFTSGEGFLADPFAAYEPDPFFDLNGDGAVGYDSGIVDIDTPIYTMTPDVQITEGESGGGFDWSAIADVVTDIAIAAVKVNQAYQQAGRPQVRVSGTSSTGQTTVAKSDGTVVVNGRTTVPPRGVPYVTPEGSVIMNNGDGTYTSVSKTGLSVTNRYPQNAPIAGGNVGFGGIDSKTLMIGGAVLVGALLLSRR